MKKDKIDPEWDQRLSTTYWINHASRLIQRRFEKHLRPIGFSMPYFQVALALKQHGKLLQKDLAVISNIEQPSMAALLSRMERDEFIVRTTHPDDKRASFISLAAGAKSTINAARKILLDDVQFALNGLSEEEINTLVTLLGKVTANLEAGEE